ncbi:hypothetical protein JYU34_012535 [Plutella xylostella]|uniref:Prominin-like protein n=2 Tax=Plutella xylostella TaxID=51655 RepID=A0ABQ7QBJ4_PLUXY|nr:hypothetical protein JYU34_012535 [Plutella xylostella]
MKCLWVVLMVAAAAGAESEGWLNKFGSNLRSELGQVLGATEVPYYEAVVNVTYVSRSEFDMRAMGPLYNSTPAIINTIANKQAYPEGIVSMSDWHIEVASLSENWRPLLAHYAGPGAVLVIAVLLAAALPIAGLFWCCCHWCRGKRRRPFDRKFDSCLKGILAIVLIALLTLFLFGVVCAFATDAQLERSAGESPAAVRAAAQDVKEFLNATQAHAHWLLVVNYKQLEDTLQTMLNNSGEQVSVQLGEFSRAVSVTALARMVRQLESVQQELRRVRNVTASLRYNAERLNTGLRKVRHQLLLTLKNCEQPQCRRLQEKYRIGQLDTQIQYNQMPDVSELLNNVSALLEADIVREVARGADVFADIQRAVRTEVSARMPAAAAELQRQGERLRNMSATITTQCARLSAATQDAAKEAAETIETAHRQYGPYRRYVGIGAATAMLLILSVLIWGLLCGVCGKRPDVYASSDCCNKASGSRWLLCGTGLMFLLGGAAALVLAAYFAVGITAQRFVCDPLTEPKGNRLFEDVDRFLDLEMALFKEHRDPDFNLSAVLYRCQDNQTIYTNPFITRLDLTISFTPKHQSSKSKYHCLTPPLFQTLHFHRIIDLEAIKSDLELQITRQVAALQPAYPTQARNVVILKPSAKEKLKQLAATGLSEFNFDRILEALETNITSLSLDSLSAQLEAAAGELMSRPAFTQLTIELRDAAAMLRTYHDDIVVPITADTSKLHETATALRDGLRFNHSSLAEAVAHLMAETEQAELFLNTQGPQLIQNLTRDFGDSIAAPMRAYLERVVRAAGSDVGRCGPLAQAYNSTRDAACTHVLMPINGYWMSLAWCILLFVPIMLVSQKLARLYRSLDPYPGPLVEA